MRTLLAAACLATALTPAFGADRWQAVMPALGNGAATCFDPEVPADQVCGALLCHKFVLNFGIMQMDDAEPRVPMDTSDSAPPMDALIDIDGVVETRRMRSQHLAGVLLLVLTPISSSDELFKRLVTGKRLRISMGSPTQDFEFTLDGAAEAFPSVVAACQR